MTNDSNENQILMNPSDVCSLLDIKESTLRKYALLLQDAGYKFHVNDKGQRGYFNEDVIVLKRFMEIKENRDMTLKQAANAVISWVEQSNMSLRVINETEKENHHNDDIQELKEKIDTQNEIIKELVKRLDEQQKRSDERDQRLEDRDKKLMEVMNQTMETKKVMLQIAAAQEEEKKGFWNKLFRR